MVSEQQREERAQRARTNGAKSKGATSPEGQKRAQTASLDHGLYAKEETLKHLVDPVLHAQLKEEYYQIWQPENRQISDKLDDMVDKRFHLNRLKGAHRRYMEELYRECGGDILEMELFASEKDSKAVRLETRIRQAELALSRLECDIIRLKKKFKGEGPSQNSLKTNATPRLPLVPSHPESPEFGNSPVAEPEMRGPEVPATPDTALRT